MEHYFYHCERNPDGFMRLKSENFRDDARERVRQEAEELRSTSSTSHRPAFGRTPTLDGERRGAVEAAIDPPGGYD